MKVRKKATRKNLILRICIFIFAAYSAVNLINMQVEIALRKQALDNMRQSVETQRLVNKELQRRIEEDMDEDVIERIARENDYVWPEEKVMIDISGS